MRLSNSLMHAARAGQQALLELVLPPVCRLCNAPVRSLDDFCKGCELALGVSQSLMRGTCPRCGLPSPAIRTRAILSSAAEANSSVPTTDLADPGDADRQAEPAREIHCQHCREGDFQFDQVVALWAYQDRVCEAVVAAKYSRQSPLGDALGRRLATVVRSRFAEKMPDIVTYVPSHLTRQITRGGNGTAVIASAVARSIGRPCRPLLRTTRAIAKQAWLEDQARLENVHGAFAVKRSYAFSRTPQPPNRHILVIDDVLTTGATANEVARVLRGSGVRRVSLAVVARAIRSQ